MPNLMPPSSQNLTTRPPNSLRPLKPPWPPAIFCPTPLPHTFSLQLFPLPLPTLNSQSSFTSNLIHFSFSNSFLTYRIIHKSQTFCGLVPAVSSLINSNAISLEAPETKRARRVSSSVGLTSWDFSREGGILERMGVRKPESMVAVIYWLYA
jgi:hypothetical protein